MKMLNLDNEAEVDFVGNFNLFHYALRGRILDHCVLYGLGCTFQYPWRCIGECLDIAKQ